MNLVWWEKTVEYQFVLEMAREEKLFLAPLDAEPERMGDAALSKDNKWVLIEFKKDLNSISTEKAKFSDYDRACYILLTRDGHHHIVYGEENLESRHCLKLLSRTYFSGQPHDLKAILGSGTKRKDFDSYILELTALKKPPKGGGSGSVGLDDLALVAGVSPDGNVVECRSLAEYQQQLGLELTQEREQEIGR